MDVDHVEGAVVQPAAYPGGRQEARSPAGLRRSRPARDGCRPTSPPRRRTSGMPRCSPTARGHGTKTVWHQSDEVHRARSRMWNCTPPGTSQETEQTMRDLHVGYPRGSRSSQRSSFLSMCQSSEVFGCRAAASATAGSSYSRPVPSIRRRTARLDVTACCRRLRHKHAPPLLGEGRRAAGIAGGAETDLPVPVTTDPPSRGRLLSRPAPRHWPRGTPWARRRAHTWGPPDEVTGDRPPLRRTNADLGGDSGSGKTTLVRPWP
ncbi:hypothetical protein SMICM17S_06674 [Streptomyces microflavus]